MAMESLGIYFHLEETKFKVDGERTERWSNVLSSLYAKKKDNSDVKSFGEEALRIWGIGMAKIRVSEYSILEIYVCWCRKMWKIGAG